MEHQGDGDTNCNWCTWNNLQRIGKGTGRLGNKKTSVDHLDYSTFKIGQNTDKSWRDLLLLTLVKNQQLTLVWKTLKGVKQKRYFV